jgi:hypothetical protein
MERDPWRRVQIAALVGAFIALLYALLTLRPSQGSSTGTTLFALPPTSALPTPSPFPVVRPFDLQPDLRAIYDQRYGGDVALLVVQTPRDPVYVTPESVGIGQCAATAVLANKANYRDVTCRSE